MMATLSEEMRRLQIIIERLETVTAAWKQAMAVEKNWYEQVLAAALEAKLAGVKVPRIIETTGISRSSLYGLVAPAEPAVVSEPDAPADSPAPEVPPFAMATDGAGPAWLR